MSSITAEETRKRAASGKASPLLDVRHLKTYFYTEDGVITAVDGVDFSVSGGEVFGLVGESGCGKSVTSLSVMRLVDAPGRIIGGEIYLEGEDLLEKTSREMTKIRGQQISMIFQQPKSSLNPVFSIGDQIVEVFQIHEKLGKEEAWRRAVDQLKMVGIPDAESKARAYPHELSGGQAQRVMIAMALALKPKLLIADEPTTALDVTIQAQVLDLIRKLSADTGTSVVLITHDLGIIAEMADRVAVMYAGQIVEETDTETLFKQPLHPYTLGLLASVPVLGKVEERLEAIPGNVPNLIGLSGHCRFADRCKAREEYELKICFEVDPSLIEVEPAHKVRCWLYEDHEGHKAPLKASVKD
jgi:oligopeptide/dipeptide ABC transporter ATP-binding protein